MTPTIPTGFGLDTPLRRAHFMAQLAHESGGFSGNYTPSGPFPNGP